MGYCPYICIFCKDVRDNGWLIAYEHCLESIMKNRMTQKQIDELLSYANRRGYTLDVCVSCLDDIPVLPFNSIATDSDC